MKTKLVWVIVGVALAACGDDERPMSMVDSGGIDAAMPDAGLPPDAARIDAGGGDAAVDRDGGPIESDASMPDGGPASCTDGRRNGDETGVDCGGPTCAARCPVDGRCEISSDCDTSVCIGRICLAPSCMDGVRNGDETGRDCGGPCVGCGLGSTCVEMDDCASGSCVGGFCVAASCTNAVRDFDETDVDCGGTQCGPCMSGEACGSDRDCTGSTCIEGYCRSASCTNGTMDGGEVGVDCGGECPGCDDGSTCTVPGDCLSGRCESGTCVSCSDGARNGTETDVDCGGDRCGPCSGGLMCMTGDDCFAGTCMAGVCTGPRVFYFEGFESGPGGWTTGGTTSSWQHGVPNGSVINRAYEGTRAWVTNLMGSYRDNEASWIQSPPIDLSAVAADPIVSFGLVYETESGWDEGWLEVSTNGGTSWTKVGAQNTGVAWYNRSTNEWDGVSGGWVRASHVLTGSAGRPDVRLRFRFASDGSNVREGFGVDSVTIRESFPADLQVTLVPDQAVCGRLIATVTNTGETTSMAFRLETSIDGGAPARENFPAGLPVGATVTRTIDGSMASTVTVSADLAGDPVPANNSATIAPSSTFVRLGAAGYREGFEANDGGWTQSGTNSTWAWGTPSGTYISAAGEGTRAWVTNLSGSYRSNELSYLVSPCFDATDLTTDVALRMLHVFQTEDGFDYGWVEMSTDGGATWTKVPAGASSMNWYNDTANGWWENLSSGWRTAQAALPGSAGQRRLRVRHVFRSDSSNERNGFGVDDVQLRPLAVDLAVSVRSSVSACGAFEAVITNVGDATATGTELTFRVDGGTPSVRSVSGAIAPGASRVESLGVTGTSVDVQIVTTGDTNPGNDAGSATASIAIGAAYATSFESGPGGWQATGTNASWAWGTPAGAYITAAASGTRAWVTNLTGNYSAAEMSYLVSPCFDLRGIAAATLSFAHIYRTQNDVDSGWIEISLDGGMTWNKLGTDASGSNWYNDAARDVWDDQGLVSGAWLDASHPLTGAGGNAQVRLRHAFVSDATTHFEGFGFDDVRIAP